MNQDSVRLLFAEGDMQNGAASDEHGGILRKCLRDVSNFSQSILGK